MRSNTVRITYLDKCIVCGGETRREMTTLHYEIDGLSIDVENVPASVCPECGEVYVPGDIGEIIGAQVKRISTTLAKEALFRRGNVVLDSGQPSEALAGSSA